MTGQTNRPLHLAILLRLMRSCSLPTCTVLSSLWDRDSVQCSEHLPTSSSTPGCNPHPLGSEASSELSKQGVVSFRIVCTTRVDTSLPSLCFERPAQEQQRAGTTSTVCFRHTCGLLAKDGHSKPVSAKIESASLSTTLLSKRSSALVTISRNFASKNK